MVKLLFILLSLNVFSSVLSIKKNRYNYKKKKTVVKKIIKKAPRKKNKNLQKIRKENKKLKNKIEQLSRKQNSFDFTKKLNIQSGTIFKGILLNSVVSSNLSSPMKVEITKNKVFPDGATLLCTSTRNNRRIYAVCDRLLDEGVEYTDLQISLLNLDGSIGLKGKYWSGDESYIAGLAISSIAKGVTRIESDSVGLNNSQLTRRRVLDGVDTSFDEVLNLMRQKLEKDSGVVSIKSGRKVLAYFHGGYSQ